MKKIVLLIVSACLIFGVFYWLNTKDSKPKALYEKEIAGLKNYIEDVYEINPYDFNITSLEHYNDSVYQSITERLSKGGLQLVLYAPEKACIDCLIKEYERLKALPDDIQDKIFIMTSFSKVRDVKSWINSRKYKYPVYNSTSFGISRFGAKNQLTLFMVNASRIPANFLIAERISDEIADSYHTYVVSEFEKGMDDSVNNEILSNGEQQEIKVDKTHDFGEINLKDKAVTFFEFENISSVPFIITDVKANCGCTVPEWDRKPAKQGEKLKVKVEFTAKEAGFFSKRITVFSNAKGSPHTLTITGSVKQKN